QTVFPLAAVIDHATKLSTGTTFVRDRPLCCRSRPQLPLAGFLPAAREQPDHVARARLTTGRLARAARRPTPDAARAPHRRGKFSPVRRNGKNSARASNDPTGAAIPLPTRSVRPQSTPEVSHKTERSYAEPG